MVKLKDPTTEEGRPARWFAQGPLIHGPDNGGIDIGLLIGEARTEASAANIVRTHNAMVRAAAPAPALDDLIEKARDRRYSDEWIGNAFRARLTARPVEEEPK